MNWGAVLAFLAVGLILVALAENKTIGPIVLGFVVIIFLVALLHSSQTLTLLGEFKEV
jgi:predicted lysophospholipase L1 biosynthesis ABC-type transport system permease subunit